MAEKNPSSDLKQLQLNLKNIRNICILAHVDHGKTTLADSLIASNGIISKRQAGKVRYMDNREDEQSRGITMKSSAISLRYYNDDNDKEFLINLIDSPGHVDFSSEVSTAVWLCDGAIVVVDAVEGVCPQTKVVLEQAWLEGVKPCLVINKIDRLITELSKSPSEAYDHIRHVLEQVNAVTGTLWTKDIMRQQYQQQQQQQQQQQDTTTNTTVSDKGFEDVVYDWSVPGLEEEDDSNVYFSPEFGNVVFTSARDGWGFSIEDFARMYSTKLGMKVAVLHNTLWGDYYLNSKTKRIHKGAYNKGKKPLFVQFILENIWSVYDAVLSQQHRYKDRIKRIATSLGLKMTPREFSHTDRHVQLSAIFTNWLPLANTILRMVSLVLPGPLDMTNDRIDRIMTNNNNINIDTLLPETQQLKKALLSCSTDSPLIVFVSKLFSIDAQLLPKHRGIERKLLSQEELIAMREIVKEKLLNKYSEENNATTNRGEEREDSPIESSETTPIIDNSTEFLGFARVFSGTIYKGQKVNILHPRYDPRDPKQDSTISQITVKELYLLMGREVIEVDSVTAGNIFGIGGLGDHVLKCCTISDNIYCPALRSTHFVGAPIVHVAIEPVHLSDMSQLVKGMKLLNQADSCVEITVQETGQHILSTAGEVHLQRCLHDLKDTFAKVPLNISEPIAPFRETIITKPTLDMVNEIITDNNDVKKTVNNQLINEASNDMGVVTVVTANKLCSLKIQATPLPLNVLQVLEKNNELLKIISSSRMELNNEKTRMRILELKSTLETCFSSTDEGDWMGVVNNIMSFGPRSIGSNILINKVNGYNRPSVWDTLTSNDQTIREYDNSVLNGFQLATLAGPLCDEPIHGVCYSLIEWNTTNESCDNNGGNGDGRNGDGGNGDGGKDDGGKGDGGKGDVYGPFSGQLISAMKEGCRKAFMVQPARLMAAMYCCGILATASILGQVYAVINRRSGRVINDEMIEGSEMFIINSLIPVAESFGFAEEIRKKTGGLALPQLLFSHWEVIPSDPFWVPSTEEELAHFGEKADSESIAKYYMNNIRRRKGLTVEEKLVQHGEKQRTLKKNK